MPEIHLYKLLKNQKWHERASPMRKKSENKTPWVFFHALSESALKTGPKYDPGSQKSKI